MELRTVDEPGPELDALVPEWEALALEVSAGFAARPAVALDWWATRGRGRLALTTARRDGRLVAVAPLHRRGAAGRPVLRWLGHGDAVLGELVAVDPAAARAVWADLVREGTPMQLARTRLAGLRELRRLHVEQRPGPLRISAVAHSRLLAPDDEPAEGAPGGRPPAPPSEVELITDVDALRARSRDLLPAAELTRSGACLEPSLRENALRAGDLVIIGAVVDDRWIADLTLVRRGRALEVWSLRTHPAVDRLAFGDRLVRSVLDRCGELGVDGVDLGLGGAELEAAWPGEGYDVVTLLSAPGPAGVVALRAAQGLDDLRRRRGAS